MSKWSDYDNAAAGVIADADTVIFRDVDDTSMAATGTQKELPFSAFKADIFNGAANIKLIDQYSDNLDTAVTAIGATVTTLAIDTAITLSATVTTPSNLYLMFIGTGSINLNGSSLEIASPSHILAPENKQIFDGTAGVTFTAGGPVHPEWWGIDGTDDDVELQLANDSIASVGGTVKLSENTTYVVSADNSQTILSTEYYAVKPSSGINWIGGAGTVVQMADNQTSGGHDASVFATNTAYQNAKFEGFTIDMNGANNDCTGSDHMTAIMVGGDSAYAKHIKILDMTFQNGPGLNVIVLGVSNSSGATLGDDIFVQGCYFYNNGIDANLTDHTSLYTWANNVRVLNNLFENPSSNTIGRLYATAWEFHGTNCFAQGNTTKYYARGCYIGANYVADAYNQVVEGNTFEKIVAEGVNVWRAGSSPFALDHLVISSNTVGLYDDNNRGGYGVRISPSDDVSDIVIDGNDFYKTGGTDKDEIGIYIAPTSSAAIDGLKVTDNNFLNLTVGAYLDTSNGSLDEFVFNDNDVKNLIPKTANLAIGLFTTGTGLTRLILKHNNFIDNQGSPTMDYGVRLAGTVTNIEADGNSYSGMTTGGYTEGSLTYTTKKIDGKWTYDVAAAASGGTDTFIVTITLQGSAVRFGLVSDVIGHMAAGENIYKQIAFTGFLSSNTMFDNAASEIFSIGDALESQLTAAAAAAVGSNNQLTITFTNADDTAFTGVLAISALTQELDQITSVTVANNQ